MNRNAIMEKLTGIFRDIFDDESIVLTDSTTAEDIDDWDSMTHIMLIGEIEETFNLKFNTLKDIMKMNNVGDIVNLLMSVE